jgi:hypothetical protein
MQESKIARWAAIVMAALLAINLVAGFALHSSTGKSGGQTDASKEISAIKSNVAALRIERPVSGKQPYPVERYSLLYKRAVIALIIVVVLNIGITLCVYRLAMKTVAPRRWTLHEIRERLAAIEKAAADISGLDEKGRELLLGDIGMLTDRIDESIKK